MLDLHRLYKYISSMHRPSFLINGSIGNSSGTCHLTVQKKEIT